MSTKLWAKSTTKTNENVTDYMTRRDLDADQLLVPYDIQGCIAHAQMLGAVGLLSADEAKAVVEKLEALVPVWAAGDFVLVPEDEDMHTAIEHYLVKELGDVGKKVHVGRSRNDQVLTAVRLYTRDMLEHTQGQVKDLATEILNFAQKHEFVPMPGFTHMQHAMPSSVGQWAGAFVESLLDDYAILQSAYALNDQNPLGSAAGFGTGVAVDREMTSKTMGFGRVQVNPIYCQNSRGKIEACTITALMQVMLSLGKIANDMIIFTSQEFGFFKVDESLTTGSSIMPQKRNLDIMEVLRGNVSLMQSLQVQCQTVGLNLISGYNKDLMITKKALLDGFEIVQESLKIVALLFQNLEPVPKALEKTFDDVELFAADYANRLVVEEGMSFRDAYKQVGENLDKLEKPDVQENIRSKTHLGATGNLGLELYKKRLNAL